MIKENHKCNGLQRKGQWPRPTSKAVYTKLAWSELNCLKTASSLQRWLFKGAQARGLWGPAAPWRGRTRLQSCSCSCTHLWTGKLQQEGILNILRAAKLWRLRCANWESMGETKPNRKHSPKERNGKGDAIQCSTCPAMVGGKARNYHPWGLFWACKILSSPSPRTFIFPPVLQGEGIWTLTALQGTGKAVHAFPPFLRLCQVLK